MRQMRAGLTGSHPKIDKLFTTLGRIGLTDGLKLCLDAGDGDSYTSGQSWLDRSGNGYDFFRGTDNTSQASDPTFTGTAGGLSSGEYWAFDGGDYFTYDGANETWMEDYHKDGAVGTILGFFYPGSTGGQAICGTQTTTTPVGFALVSSSGGQLQFQVSNGSAANVLSKASGANGDIAPTAWNFFALSWDEAANTGSIFIRDKITSITSTYSSPASGAADAALQIGAVGSAGSPVRADGRLGMIAMWSRSLTDIEVTQIKQATRARFGV